MDVEAFYRYEERIYLLGRFVLFLTVGILAFLLYGQLPERLGEKILETAFTALVLVFVAIGQYYYTVKFPDTTVELRKLFVVVMDSASLTYFVYMMGEYGIFLLPLYIVIVMRSGLNLGVGYLYAALLVSLGCMALLYVEVPYWQARADILVSFALATLIVPLSYLKHLIYFHESNLSMEEEDHSEGHSGHYTGLAGRDAYKNVLVETIQRHQPFSLLFLSIAGYAKISEEFGATAAERVVGHVAHKLSELCKERAFSAQLSENEFAVILEGDKNTAEQFAKELIRHLTERYRIAGHVIPIEVVIGISRYPEDSKAVMMLGRYADMALQAAKNKIGTYRFYDTLSENEKSGDV